MSLTLNATGTKQYHAAATSFDYTGMTVASGSNTALLVVITFGHNNGVTTSAVACHWDSAGGNQAMTQLAFIDDGFFTACAVFGLVAPAAGNKTLHINWTGSAEVFVDAVAWDGADQTGGATSFPHSQTATLVHTLTLSSATGNKAVCAMSPSGNTGTTGTQLYLDASSGALINGAACYDDGTASLVIGNSGQCNSLAAADVIPAAGGGGAVVPFNLFQHSA